MRTEEYGARIAREWNTKDAANGSVGYVLRFDVDDEYLSRHDVHQVGGRDCREYWIPADELDDFNAHLTTTVVVIAAFRAANGDGPQS